MENYIFITRDFHVLCLADRLRDDGKEVVLGMVQEEENKKTPPAKSEARLALYDDILEKHDADDVLDWMKGIENKDEWFVIFDYGDLFEYSEKALKMGFTRGIFPTEEGYRLEKDRQYGKEFAKKNYPQLKVAEVHEFKKVDDAIKFLEEQSDKIFVLKSEGSNAETVVPQSPDFDLCRRQLVGALQSEKGDYEKGGFTLEEKILNPIELSPVMLFWNGKPLFSVVELENKPLGAGNIGRLTGGCQNLTIQTALDCELNKIAFPPVVYEMAKKTPGIGLFDAGLLFDGKDFLFTEFCFDTETEILTNRGWLKHDELRMGDEALSLNPITENMEWKPILKKILRIYRGPMIQLKQPTFDALVTPEHHFWVKKSPGSKQPLVQRRAIDLKAGNAIPRTGKWHGVHIAEIVLSEMPVFVPERIVKKGEWVRGKQLGDRKRREDQCYGTNTRLVRRFKRHTLPQMRFKTMDIAWLIGLWLAEGCFCDLYKGEPRGIMIAQKKGTQKCVKIENRLREIGLHFVSSPSGLKINKRRLAIYFWSELGLANTHAPTKFIPQFFKELSLDCLSELIAGYMIGDGSRHKNQWVCGTVSKRLADDLQEVMHKVGWAANITRRKCKDTTFQIHGKTFTRRNDIFILSTREKKNSFQVKTTNKSVIDYDGLVWDVEIADNHSMFVRRNGRAFFSSNCSQRWGFDGIFSEIAMCGDAKGTDNAVRHFDLIAQGKNPLLHKYGASVRLFQTEPHGKHPDMYSEDYQIDWLDEVSDQLFLYCIKGKKADEGKVAFQSCGYEKDLGVCTGTGDTVDEAVNNAYRCADGIAMTGLMFRPKFDFLSRDYFTGIPNRLDFLEHSGLI